MQDRKQLILIVNELTRTENTCVFWNILSKLCKIKNFGTRYQLPRVQWLVIYRLTDLKSLKFQQIFEEYFKEDSEEFSKLYVRSLARTGGWKQLFESKFSRRMQKDFLKFEAVENIRSEIFSRKASTKCARLIFKLKYYLDLFCQLVLISNLV